MGTRFAIVAHAPDSATAARAAIVAFNRIEELERTLSDYNPESELSRLSATAGTDRWITVSPDLWAVVTAAQRWASRTDGAFDVTVGPITRLWRWARRRGVLPPAERLGPALRAVGYELLSMDNEHRRIRLGVPGMQLDVGAVGKGYAADVALRTMRDYGLHSVLIDAGGDVVVGNPPPGEVGWRVAIPVVIGSRLDTETLHISRSAIATSGDTYRFVEVDGVRYSHLVDPRNGWALRVRRVVTVVAASGTEADILATAISVLGPARGLALIDSIPGIDARVMQPSREDVARWHMWTSN